MVPSPLRAKITRSGIFPVHEAPRWPLTLLDGDPCCSPEGAKANKAPPEPEGTSVGGLGQGGFVPRRWQDLERVAGLPRNSVSQPK